MSQFNPYPPIIDLNCTLCGEPCRGRQWAARQQGEGLCAGCIPMAEVPIDLTVRPDQPELKAEAMKSAYGVRFCHYDVPERGDSVRNVEQNLIGLVLENSMMGVKVKQVSGLEVIWPLTAIERVAED